MPRKYSANGDGRRSLWHRCECVRVLVRVGAVADRFPGHLASWGKTSYDMQYVRKIYTEQSSRGGRRAV